MNVEVIGKRKLEVGLVVPAKYDPFTRNKQIAMILDEELAKWKKLYKSCLELKHQLKNIYRMLPAYQQNTVSTEQNTVNYQIACCFLLLSFKREGSLCKKKTIWGGAFTQEGHLKERGCLLEKMQYVL